MQDGILPLLRMIRLLMMALSLREKTRSLPLLRTIP